MSDFEVVEKYLEEWEEDVDLREVAGENLNKMGIFLQLLSKDFEDPLMIFGVQKQGEGKSYIAKKVLELFPDHMVIDVTDMKKAALYRRAQQDKNYFNDKIVYFGEVPEQDEDRTVFQVFRQLVSEGKVSKELVLDQEGDFEPERLELEGAPCVLTTTTNEGLINEQDLSRGMAYSPSISKEQNIQVREFQNTDREFPEELIHPEEIEETKQVIKCAMDLLSNDEVKLQNPFARDIDNQVPKNTDNIKRDYPKTLRIASEMPTYLYHRQRPNKRFLEQNIRL